MYPEVCALLPGLKDDVLESYEEHHVADVLCMELAGMSADAERFDAKATVLIENVTHHIEEEEQDWFPKVRAGLGRKQLQELGAKLARNSSSSSSDSNVSAARSSRDRGRSGSGFELRSTAGAGADTIRPPPRSREWGLPGGPYWI